MNKISNVILSKGRYNKKNAFKYFNIQDKVILFQVKCLLKDNEFEKMNQDLFLLVQ